jgi:hypothetical protein
MYFNSTKLCSLLLASILSFSLSAKEGVPAVGQGVQKPLCFVENKGQITDNDHKIRTDIQYKLSTPGMSLFVGNAQLHYYFKKTAGTTSNPDVTAYMMNVTLLGANAHAQAVSQDKAVYEEHYYLANSGSNGIAASAYNKITYKDVYPNIDWVLYVKNGKVEYDFVVRPGGDVSKIQLQYGDATSLNTTADGGIAAETPMGKVQEKKPFAYENGTGREVAANFKLNNNIVSFETGNYDGTLTIDPYLLWSTYWGGATEDVATCVKVSTTGDVYVGGYTNSTLGVSTGGGFQNAAQGGFDAFIARFNAAGAIVAASYFGGTGDDIGTSIAIDAAGTGVYLAGYTASTATTLATAGAYHATNLGGTNDGFLVKFTTACTRTWSTFYGGPGDDFVRGVACDATNNVYITGQTSSSTSIASAPTVYAPGLNGAQDAFIAKFSTAGAISYSTYFGGSAIEDANAIAIDASNNAIITGQTNSIVGIATTGAYDGVLNGTNDAFVAKMNATGTAVLFGTYFGGTGTEEGRGIVCNTTTGDVAVIGYTTSSSSIASANAYQTSYGGGAQDAFVAYITAAGNVSWSTYYGGPGLDFGEGICLDPSKNVVITGGTFSTSGIASAGSFQPAIGGDYDAFVAKLTPLGQRMWGSYFGSTLYDYAYGVACSTNGQIVIAGHTTSTAGISTVGAAHTVYGGGTYDAFIARFKTDSFVTINQPFTDTLICAGGSLNVPYSVNINFQLGNVFTAKMYNAAGTYVGDIGSIATNTSSVISGTVPVGAGTGYRIRITSTNPAMTSADDYKDITVVSALPPATPVSNSPVCVGSTLYLYGSAPWAVTNYVWYDPTGSFLAVSQNTSVYPTSLTDAGTYSLVATHNGCPDDVSTVNVIVNSTIPAAPIASASALNCVGGSISLTAAEPTGATATYAWTGPASYSSSIQNPTITGVTMANAGTYSVVDTVAGCWSAATTVTVTVTGTSPASVAIDVSPNDTVCGGTLVNFTTTTTNAGISPTFQWMNGSTPIVGAFSSTWSSNTITDGEVVSVVMHSDGICPSPINATSNTIKMTVITNEPVVHIFANPGVSVAPGDSVTFTSITYNVGVGPTYQWQRNGVDIPGATNDTYKITHVTTFDTIRLVVTSTMDCASTNFGISNSLVPHPNTGVATISSSLDNIAVFPNPNAGSFTVRGDMQNTNISSVGIEILNPLGQVIYRNNVSLQNGKLNTSIGLNDLASGIYLLQVSSDGRSKTIRFSVQH